MWSWHLYKSSADLVAQESTIVAIDREHHNIVSPNPSVAIKFQRSDFTLHKSVPAELDGILIANALHYVSDQQNFLQNLISHLKPGARIIIVEYDTDRAKPVGSLSTIFRKLSELLSGAGFRGNWKNWWTQFGLPVRSKIYAVVATVWREMNQYCTNPVNPKILENPHYLCGSVWEKVAFCSWAASSITQKLHDFADVWAEGLYKSRFYRYPWHLHYQHLLGNRKMPTRNVIKLCAKRGPFLLTPTWRSLAVTHSSSQRDFRDSGCRCRAGRCWKFRLVELLMVLFANHNRKYMPRK